MPLAVVLILLVVGSLIFHVLSPWTFTELASNWSMIDFTIDITFWVTGAVFVAVNLFMAYCVIKFRYKKEARATYEPENKKLETWLTVLTAIGVAAMLTPGLFVWAKFVDVPEEAHEVEAVGQQWRWSYRYPGEDGKFGLTDAKLMTDENPFGMNPDDPNGQDDVLVYHPEAHVPVDKPVKWLLRSKDVLHNFTVTEFRVKMDLVPGMTTFQWLTPTNIGRYDVLWVELCGFAHFAMRGAVYVDEQEDFDAWLAEQPTYAELNARPAGDPAAGAASYAVCAACHGPQGEGLVALNAPKIAGQDAWYLRASLRNYQAGIRGSDPDDTYGLQMAPMAATLATDAMIENVIAYIQTFPDNPAPHTIEGDTANGERLYNVCAYCHGADGMGLQATKAPRLAGMTDWYIERQLLLFRNGDRGQHPSDFYGFQMGFMAKNLRDEQAIKDLVAYINTL